jgi:hypothetical protein
MLQWNTKLASVVLVLAAVAAFLGNFTWAAKNFTW